MKATSFEFRHQTLLHLLVIGLSLLSYIYDRVDIVWAVVRNHSNSASWERLVFGFGAVVLLGSALLETWANAPAPVAAGANGSLIGNEPQNRYRERQARLARILLVLAVGLLLPLAGTITLLAGETILMLRLSWLDNASHSPSLPRRVSRSWGSAFRLASSKWGLTASMIVFVWTLQDRLAEIGAVSSLVVGLVLNFYARNRPTG
jgi:hypothetical protein